MRPCRIALPHRRRATGQHRQAAARALKRASKPLWRETRAERLETDVSLLQVSGAVRERHAHVLDAYLHRASALPRVPIGDIIGARGTVAAS